MGYVRNSNDRLWYSQWFNSVLVWMVMVSIYLWTKGQVMKTFLLMEQDRTFITVGKSSAICEHLGVTRQALSKAVKTSGVIRGYLIEAYPYEKPIRKSKNWYLGKSLELLRNARHIIDDYNKELISRNEYANVNIIMRIDRLLSEAKDKLWWK